MYTRMAKNQKRFCQRKLLPVLGHEEGVWAVRSKMPKYLPPGATGGQGEQCACGEHGPDEDRHSAPGHAGPVVDDGAGQVEAGGDHADAITAKPTR